MRSMQKRVSCKVVELGLFFHKITKFWVIFWHILRLHLPKVYPQNMKFALRVDFILVQRTSSKQKFLIPWDTFKDVIFVIF